VGEFTHVFGFLTASGLDSLSVRYVVHCCPFIFYTEDLTLTKRAGSIFNEASLISNNNT
jgi:hypothetical protein